MFLKWVSISHSGHTEDRSIPALTRFDARLKTPLLGRSDDNRVWASPRVSDWWDTHFENVRKTPEELESHLFPSALILRRCASSLGDATPVISSWINYLRSINPGSLYRWN